MFFALQYKALKESVTLWCQGKNGFVRLPLLILFVYIFVRHLGDPNYYGLFGAINLGIHELGHVVFFFTGKFLEIAGGTILQLAAPIYGVYNFLKQDDYFAAALCFGWLSTNFFGVATYAGDAHAMALPLVAPFGAPLIVIHDWNYLLTQTGLLSFYGEVALFFRFCAILSMGLCLIGGGWMIILMIKNSFRTNKSSIW